MCVVAEGSGLRAGATKNNFFFFFLFAGKCFITVSSLSTSPSSRGGEQAAADRDGAGRDCVSAVMKCSATEMLVGRQENVLF